MRVYFRCACRANTRQDAASDRTIRPSALRWISDHLGHPLHPVKSILLKVEDHSVDILKSVVAVETPALFRRLEIAVETSLPLLLQSPFDQKTPGAVPPVLLCCNEKREYYPWFMSVLTMKGRFGIGGSRRT